MAASGKTDRMLTYFFFFMGLLNLGEVGYGLSAPHLAYAKLGFWAALSVCFLGLGSAMFARAKGKVQAIWP